MYIVRLLILSYLVFFTAFNYTFSVKPYYKYYSIYLGQTGQQKYENSKNCACIDTSFMSYLLWHALQPRNTKFHQNPSEGLRDVLNENIPGRKSDELTDRPSDGSCIIIKYLRFAPLLYFSQVCFSHWLKFIYSKNKYPPIITIQ